MQTKRIEMRIRRLKRRAVRIERWLAEMGRWDAGKHRPFRAFVLEILDEDPDATDEEIIEALIEKADELTRFSGPAELISDVGIRLAARLVVFVYKNRETLLRRRLEQVRGTITRLQAELERTGPRGALGGDDELDIFRDLGMDDAFIRETTGDA
jgi:hypothetical protein